MVHPTNLVILFQGDHLLISYRARDTFALCTIADVSSLVNISRKNVQCWWPTFSLQETTGLPADLAVMNLEELVDVPVLILTAHSFPPGTLIDVRVLGAILTRSAHEEQEVSFALDGWFLVAVASIDSTLTAYSSLEQLPLAQQIALKRYVL